MRKLFALLSLLVLASLVLSACGGATPTEAPAQPEQPEQQPAEPQIIVVTATPGAEAVEEKEAVLRVNIGTYPDVIDPQKSSFVNEIAHLKLVYEGLTKYNEKLETVPGAAESWTYNDDATELTFTLRPDLTYADGSQLNAQRFAYAIKRNINPETAGEYASITDEILGAPEWRGADITAADYDAATFEAALGVKASHADGADCVDYEDADCNTLKLTLSKPAPYFHTIMGIWVAFPAKQEGIDEGGENWWNGANYHVGNGPFIYDTLEPYVRSFFTPNANYWGDKPSYSLEFRYVTDLSVALEAYRNNEFEVIEIDSALYPAIQGDPDLNSQALVYAGSCTLVVKYGLAAKYTAPDGSEYDSPFLDKKVREAFAYAFNADGWANDLENGLAAPTWTWIPPGYPGYDASSPMSFDPEKAKQALAESTFAGPDALNVLGLKLTFGDTPLNRARSEWLVANYKDVLGVDIALDPIEPTTFTAITKDPKTFPLLARQGWCADYPDPQNWLSVYWRSDTTFAQRQGYVNTEFDALVNEADVTLDPAKRMELYAQAQQLLLADIPSAFGYNPANAYLVKPWVKGIITTPQDSGWPGEQAPAQITIDASMMP
jgi:oligopeptide transport system substrate-binding protein